MPSSRMLYVQPVNDGFPLQTVDWLNVTHCMALFLAEHEWHPEIVTSSKMGNIPIKLIYTVLYLLNLSGIFYNFM